MSGSFEFVDSVTSDLSFVASGESLGEVFARCGDALLAATLENPEALEGRETRRLELRDRHADLLLLRFLNELIYLRDAEDLVLRPLRVDVENGDGFELRAELAGEPLDLARHRIGSEPKAATAHGLAVERAKGGWRAAVTLDV